MKEKNITRRRIPPLLLLTFVVVLLLLDAGLAMHSGLFRSAGTRNESPGNPTLGADQALQELLYESILTVCVDGKTLEQPGLYTEEGQRHYAPAEEFLAAMDPDFWMGEKESFSYTVYGHNGTPYLCIEEFCGAYGVSACMEQGGKRLWCSSSAGSWTLPEGKTVPVLFYNGLGDGTQPETKGFVKPNMLDWQIYTLLTNGYTPIRFEDLKHADLVEKPVLLCFDSSDPGTWENLLPLLKKYGIKVTLFVDVTAETRLAEMADTGLVSLQCRLGEGQDPIQIKAILLYASQKEPYAVYFPDWQPQEELLEPCRTQFHFCLHQEDAVYVTGSDPLSVPCIPITGELTLEDFSQRFA